MVVEKISKPLETQQIEIYLFEMSCWKCHKKTIVIYPNMHMRYDDGSTNFFAEGISELLKLLYGKVPEFKIEYPFVKPVFNQCLKKVVVANTCSYCQAHIG